MWSPDNNSQSSFPSQSLDDATGGATDAPTHRRVAHELANLLDGSMRNLGLAIRQIRRDASGESDVAQEPHAEATLIPKLEAASQAMRQMSQLLGALDGNDVREEQHAPSHTIAEVIEHAVNLLRPIAEAANVRISSDMQSAVADSPAGDLYPAIINALQNALEAITNTHATPSEIETPRIHIHGEQEDAEIVLSITDNGPGVDPRLFDQAGKLRTGITTKPDGKGIGLQIIQQVVGEMGGSMSLENIAPHGACLALRVKPLVMDGESSRGIDEAT